MSELAKDLCLDLLRRMIRIRAFEERITKMVKEGDVSGSAHTGIGQEAVYVGICAALRNDDTITGTHRSHGHPIAKGAALNGLMAEIMGKATGVNRGKGGSMHLADSSVGCLGETAILGSGTPIACGAALAYQLRGEDKVSAVFFGDGAAQEGTPHESMNLASAWKLPVIFVLENNESVTTMRTERIHSVRDYAVRAAGYNMPGVGVDGQNVEKVYDAMREAVARARAGFGPTLIECKTQYFNAHAEGPYLAMLQPKYRDLDLLECYKKYRDPIVLFERKLLGKKVLNQGEIDEMRDAAYLEVEEAYQFGKNSPEPEPAELYTHLFSNPINV